MDIQEKIEKISQMGDRELEFRRKMINFAIRTCLLEGDPQNAIPKWREQLGRIQDEIRKRNQIKHRKNGGKPPQVQIDAKLGKMGAKQPK